MQRLIALNDLVLDQTLQVRVRLSLETIEEYTAAYQSRHVFPPIMVFQIEKLFVVADGMHRVHAARKAGRSSILAEILRGTREECLRWALKANMKHGLRMNNEDKRRAVQLALAQWPNLSSRELAEYIGVSHAMVARYRPDAADVPADPMPQPEPQPDIVTVVAEDPKPRPSRGLPPHLVPGAPRKQHLDKMGFPVPDKLHAYWVRDGEAVELLSAIRFVRSRLEDAERLGDKMYTEVNFTSANADLTRALATLETVRPYAVCPSCQGQLCENCSMCGGRGLVSKFRWDNVVPVELRALREKQIAEERTDL